MTRWSVHPYTWTAESFRTLYNRYRPGWCHEPELLVRADCCIPDTAIWEAHQECKRALVEICEQQALRQVMDFGDTRRSISLPRPLPELGARVR